MSLFSHQDDLDRAYREVAIQEAAKFVKFDPEKPTASAVLMVEVAEIFYNFVAGKLPRYYL